MKKWLYRAVVAGILTVLMFGCGGKGTTDDDTDDDAAPSAPESPSNLVADAEQTTVILAWQDNSSDESGFNIYYRRAADAEFARLATVNANTTSYVYTAVSDEHYFFYVTAYNDAGESEPSNTAETKTVPATPAGVQAIGQGDSIAIEWVDMSDVEDSYLIYYRDAGDTDFQLLVQLDADQTQYVDQCGYEVTREYVVAAANGAGQSDASDVVSATTAPNPPTGLTIESEYGWLYASVTLTLGWEDNSDVEEAYVIERRGYWGGDWEEVAELPADSTSYTIENADCDLAYSTFRVAARSEAGDSYSDEASADLEIGCWRSMAIDSAGVVGLDTSLFVDSDNRVHISYQYCGPGRSPKCSVGDLRYSTNESGTWEIYTVDEYGDTGQTTSIALDQDGHVHISYFLSSPGYDLRYATNKSGEWETFTIDSEESVGQGTSLVVDDEGNVYIAYYHITGGNLRLATNKSGEWEISVLDDSCDVGMYVSMAMDSEGHLHISYFDNCDGNLKYATNASGEWEIAVLDSSWWVGLDTSITLDQDDNVYISYKGGGLKYATNKSGEWEVFTLDTDGNTGAYTSIGLDQDGNIHISYYRFTSGSLKYATNRSGEWKYYYLDHGGSAGRNSSLKVDSDGFIHISYTDDYFGDLKYATNRPPPE